MNFSCFKALIELHDSFEADKHIIEQVIRNQFVLWSVFSNVYF